MPDIGPSAQLEPISGALLLPDREAPRRAQLEAVTPSLTTESAMSLHDLAPHRVTESLPDGVQHISDKQTSPSVYVAQFHERFGVAVNVPITDERTAALRLSLIREEADELAEAIASGNVLKVARELADLTYVVYGSALTWGLELDDLWPALVGLNVEREVDRLADAIANGDLALAAVALENLRDVAIAIARQWDINLDAAVAAVHAANMRKMPASGSAGQRLDGKILKPPGWTPPDLSRAVAGRS